VVDGEEVLGIGDARESFEGVEVSVVLLLGVELELELPLVLRQDSQAPVLLFWVELYSLQLPELNLIHVQMLQSVWVRGRSRYELYAIIRYYQCPYSVSCALNHFLVLEDCFSMLNYKVIDPLNSIVPLSVSLVHLALQAFLLGRNTLHYLAETVHLAQNLIHRIATLC